MLLSSMSLYVILINVFLFNVILLNYILLNVIQGANVIKLFMAIALVTTFHNKLEHL